jgi:flagellar motor switch protein FliN
MSDLTPELAAQIVDACQAGAQEAADALSRNLDGQFTLQVGEAGACAGEGAAAALDGPGLSMVLTFGDAAMIVLLPESSGLVPEWYADPDPTGESKLSTLAQELSMLLVPETLMADAFVAGRVDSLQQALERGQPSENAALVPLGLESNDHSGQMTLVWPLANPDAVLIGSTDQQQEESPDQPGATPQASPSSAETPTAGGPLRDFSQLPGYSKSLLRIQVPVSVQLATKKEKIQDIVEMVPGSIIKFDKGCEEQLQMFVGDQEIALGEAVKVGDRFGFRVSAMQMPQEHFHRVK